MGCESTAKELQHPYPQTNSSKLSKKSDRTDELVLSWPTPMCLKKKQTRFILLQNSNKQQREKNRQIIEA